MFEDDENTPELDRLRVSQLCECTKYIIIHFFFYKFIYLFLAVLGLRFCVRAFSSCGERGPLFILVRRPLTVAASRCGAQAPDAQAQ